MAARLRQCMDSYNRESTRTSKDECASGRSKKPTLKKISSERKAEREREHSRHAASLRQLEHSLNSRERMYKERILGLEEQVRI